MSNKEKTDWYMCPRCFGTGKSLKINGVRLDCSFCKGTVAITASIKIIRKENGE